MQNDAKFEEELTCRFKIDMRNLTNFDSSTRKSQKFTIEWAPFIQGRKCMRLKLKDELCVMTMNNDAKFLRGIDLSFQN